MTISFGEQIPKELEVGCRLTVYFKLTDYNNPDVSMGYYLVTENSSSRCILHSVFSKESYSTLKRENGEWECLRETSRHNIELLGYALWVSEYEIHGFVPEDTRPVGKLVLVGVDNLCCSREFEGVKSLNFSVFGQNSFDIRLDDTGQIDVEESDGCDVEVFKNICSEFSWFSNITSNNHTDYLRVKLDRKPVINQGESIRIESIS